MATMVTKTGNTEEVLVSKFKRVKNGLDEAQVLSAIKELMERNKDLTDRFAHIDSLTKLAERTVVQAEQEAQIIKRAVEVEVTSKGARIIAGAEEKARSEADRLIAEAQQWADKAAKTTLTSAQRQAEEIIRAAETQAQQQAERMMKAAEAKARSEAEQIVEAAEAEAQRRAEEIVKAAETRAQQKAQKSLPVMRKMSKRVIVEEFRKFVEDMVSDDEKVETQSPGLKETAADNISIST